MVGNAGYAGKGVMASLDSLDGKAVCNFFHRFQKNSKISKKKFKIQKFSKNFQKFQSNFKIFLKNIKLSKKFKFWKIQKILKNSKIIFEKFKNFFENSKLFWNFQNMSFSDLEQGQTIYGMLKTEGQDLWSMRSQY